MKKNHFAMNSHRDKIKAKKKQKLSLTKKCYRRMD